MKKRKLGNSDLELSVIGLGTWAIGGGDWEYGWGAQDDAASIACIHEAIDLGINWIDTAAVYGLGRSELVIGKALKDRPGKVLVATKCGLLSDKTGQVYGKLKSASILNEVEESLKRLQVDCIDIYQIHWPNPSQDVEEAFQTLLNLKSAGKIRHASVCNFSRDQLSRANAVGKISSLQSPYSLLNRGVEIDILPWCIEQQIGFLAYSPLQCGLLTGKVSKEWVSNLPASDWRKSKSQYFKGKGLEAALEYVEQVRAIVCRGKDGAQNALSGAAVNWLLNQPGVTSVIAGARSPGQIASVVESLAVPLGSAELTAISKIPVPTF